MDCQAPDTPQATAHCLFERPCCPPLHTRAHLMRAHLMRAQHTSWCPIQPHAPPALLAQPPHLCIPSPVSNPFPMHARPCPRRMGPTTKPACDLDLSKTLRSVCPPRCPFKADSPTLLSSRFLNAWLLASTARACERACGKAGRAQPHRPINIHVLECQPLVPAAPGGHRACLVQNLRICGRGCL